MEESLGVNLDEADPFFVVRYFFEFHYLIVVVDGFFIQNMRQQVNDVLVDVPDVEDLCDLNVHYIPVLCFCRYLLVYQVNLVMLLALYLSVTLSKISLQLLVLLLDSPSPLSHQLPTFPDRPAADCPSINPVRDLLLFHVLQELLPLDIELEGAHYLVECELVSLLLTPDVF